MPAESVNIVVTNHSPHDSDRNRLLNNWVVCGKLCKDETTWLYTLVGEVVQEADGTKPAGRITETSPIVAYSKGVVTTVSGSKYRLGKANVLQTAGTSMLVDEVLNPWIDGDNWLTQ